MPESEAKRLETWEKRLSSANKLYDKWSQEFSTDHLEEYYKGHQWKGMPEEDARKRYVINMTYASIEVNKPTLVFGNPQVRVQARPERGNDLGSMEEEKAKLCRDAVQTFIDDPDLDFELETSLALHEAHFRFGVVEVGYTSDAINNPEAGKPVLKEDNKTPVKDPDSGKPLVQPDKLLTGEWLYVKRIPANTFRCSISSKNKLLRNDWVAYYEWVYVEDVKRNKAYSNTSQLKSSGVVSKEIREDTSDRDRDDLSKRHGMVKIWKIWDIRRRVRHTIADGHKKFLQEDVPFPFLPFAVIKFHEILDSFYPLPPTFNWIGPQDETNETRDQQRAHRRRFYRRYTYMDGAIETTEMEKLENGGDGVYAKANQPNPITPVPDAPLSADNWTHLDQSRLDFMTVSAVGGEQRGVAESETATQASIIDVRSRIRETAARNKVAKWLAQIARLMLLTLREDMALPFWVKRTTSPTAPPQESAKVEILWQQIQAESLGEMDLDVFIDLASMSPITEDMQRSQWNQVLALITNPTILQVLSQSEVLMRKTLAMYGVKAENEIREIQKVAQQVSMSLQLAAMAGAKSPAGASSTAKPNGAGGSPITPDRLSSVLGAATQGA